MKRVVGAIVAVAALLLTAGCTRTPLLIAGMDAEDIQRVPNDALCHSSAVFLETRGRRFPNIEAEIDRRGLPCGDNEDVQAAAAPPPVAAPVASPAQSASRALQNVNMRSGPGTGYAVLGLLRAGETVTVIRAVNGWCECMNSTGRVVFIRCSLLSPPRGGWVSLGSGSPLVTIRSFESGGTAWLVGLWSYQRDCRAPIHLNANNEYVTASGQRGRWHVTDNNLLTLRGADGLKEWRFTQEGRDQLYLEIGDSEARFYRCGAALPPPAAMPSAVTGRLQGFPPEAMAMVAEAERICRAAGGELGDFGGDWYFGLDINRDGRNDYLLNAHNIGCDIPGRSNRNMPSPYCVSERAPGELQCRSWLIVSQPRGQFRVAWTAVTDGAATYNRHGPVVLNSGLGCQAARHQTCEMIWNGRTLASASPRPRPATPRAPTAAAQIQLTPIENNFDSAACRLALTRAGAVLASTSLVGGADYAQNRFHIGINGQRFSLLGNRGFFNLNLRSDDGRVAVRIRGVRRVWVSYSEEHPGTVYRVSVAVTLNGATRTFAAYQLCGDGAMGEDFPS